MEKVIVKGIPPFRFFDTTTSFCAFAWPMKSKLLVNLLICKKKCKNAAETNQNVGIMKQAVLFWSYGPKENLKTTKKITEKQKKKSN